MERTSSKYRSKFRIHLVGLITPSGCFIGFSRKRGLIKDMALQFPELCKMHSLLGLHVSNMNCRMPYYTGSFKIK